MNIQQIIEILELDNENVKVDFANQNCSFCADHAPKIIRNKMIIYSLKKQDPVKVRSTAYNSDFNILSGECPSCGNFVSHELKKRKKAWCNNCGQALEWKS